MTDGTIEGRKEDSDQIITPWKVQGSTINNESQSIDYDRLIKDFGTSPITIETLNKFKEITKHEPHIFLKRGIFFSERDLLKILEYHKEKKPFFLYTGRGPSSTSMHLGHIIPFVFTKWLQDVFGVPLIIELTDDEKFLFNPKLKIEDVKKFNIENAKDIISIGFDHKNTFIFSDLNYMNSSFYENVVKVSNQITASKSKAVFGFNDSDSIGKFHFCSVQIATSFCSSFPDVLGLPPKTPCLIPCAIDQDPYFRICRDVAGKLNYSKPSLIHSKFFPSLKGFSSKMSSSDPNSSIFLDDTPNEIKKKINKYAFSGGRDSIEDHKKFGGQPDIDIAYQYLLFFCEDDIKLKKIYESYKSGQLLSGELKAECITVVQNVIDKIQKKRKTITDAHIKLFMDTHKITGNRKLES